MSPRQSKGRKGGTETLRELISILGSLTHTGDTIELDALASRLGVSVSEAHRLMDIVCMASGEESSGLLVSCNAEETEFTLQYPGVRGKPLRLTPPETIAVLHALDQAGISDDDPLRVALANTLSTTDVQISEVRKSLGSGVSSQIALTCARARSEGRVLILLYKGANETTARQRRLAVQSLYLEEGIWYLNCIDLDIGQERTFREDRVQEARLGSDLPRVSSPKESKNYPSVRVVFTDKTYYRAFDWPGLKVVQEDDTTVTADIPYYGESSNWLIRRIASCGGALQVEDAGILAATRHYAQKLRDSLPTA